MAGDSLPQWMQNLIAGWPMIKANIPTFIVILLLLAGALWLLFNWSYGSILANKSSQIELQDRQLADYKQKLDGASPDQAKARIDTLEARLAAIEPRRLTADQRASLKSKLGIQAPAATLISIAGEASGDSMQLAADFASVFRAAGGWTVQESSVIGIGNRPANGLRLTVKNSQSPSREVQLVVEALRSARIDFEVLGVDVMAPGLTIELLVCTKISR
jgi:hypothetical protein